MNIDEEKIYIYKMLRDITKERRQLVEMYFDLKKRLDFLNLMEERGVEELNITGYVNLYNQTQKEIAVTNIKRETEHIIEKIENNIEEIETPIIPKEEIQRVIEHENKGKRLSKEKVQSTVISILKDAGAPLKLSEIIKRTNFVLSSNLKSGYFSNIIIPDLLKNSNKVEKPATGFYQYRL
jgi:hypothetical protein